VHLALYYIVIFTFIAYKGLADVQHSVLVVEVFIGINPRGMGT